MRTINTMQVADIRALLDRIAVLGADGHENVEETQFYAGMQRIERTQRTERTAFDYADEKNQSPNWPKMGRWVGNDQGKDTQIARRDDL